MDKLTLLGLLIGLTGILSGQLLEGGDLTILFQGAPFLIVFGGTLGAVMVQCPANVFFTAIKMARWVFVTPPVNSREMIRKLTEYSVLARKEGILALEGRMNAAKDPFLKKGLQLLVDGNSAEKSAKRWMSIFIRGNNCAGNRRGCGKQQRATRPPSASSARCWV